MPAPQHTRYCGTINQGHIDAWNAAGNDPQMHEIHADRDWNYEFDMQVIKYVVWQIERTQAGHLHIQIYVQLRKKKTFAGFTRMLPGHWEVQGSPDNKRAADYCKKKDASYVRGFWERGQFTEGKGSRSDLDEIKELIDEGATLRDICVSHPQQYQTHFRWITDYIKLVRENKVARVTEFTGVEGVVMEWHKWVMGMVTQDPHPRKIFWFVDAIGGTGKSYLASYLRDSHQAFVCTGGKPGDIMFGYSQEGCSGLVVMDLPRDTDELKSSALEAFKNGHGFSTKYQSGSISFNRPHLLVFSNHLPGGGQFSADRLVIVRIVDGEWTAESKAQCLAAHPVEL